MDQLGLIAECVQSYSGGKITSDGKEFYFDGAPIPKPAIESFIEATLASIELLHPVHRRRVPANRKMLVEVLAKIATKYYRQPSTSTKYLRTVHSAENFLNENVLLDSTRWTASADIYGAYLHWCEARNALPLDEPVFFKALSRWGVESVARVKSRAAGRAPGYRGIVLRL
jgi:hypothetical protein